MPPQFELPNTVADVWRPLPTRVDWTERSKRYLRVIGRLRHGHDIEDARRELAQIAHQLARDHPASNANWERQHASPIDTVGEP